MTSKLGVTPSRFGEIAIANLSLTGGTGSTLYVTPFHAVTLKPEGKPVRKQAEFLTEPQAETKGHVLRW
jgi:hypothetical protein